MWQGRSPLPSDADCARPSPGAPGHDPLQASGSRPQADPLKPRAAPEHGYASRPLSPFFILAAHHLQLQGAVPAARCRLTATMQATYACSCCTRKKLECAPERLFVILSSLVLNRARASARVLSAFFRVVSPVQGRLIYALCQKHSMVHVAGCMYKSFYSAMHGTSPVQAGGSPACPCLTVPIVTHVWSFCRDQLRVFCTSKRCETIWLCFLQVGVRVGGACDLLDGNGRTCGAQPLHLGARIFGPVHVDALRGQQQGPLRALRDDPDELGLIRIEAGGGAPAKGVPSCASLLWMRSRGAVLRTGCLTHWSLGEMAYRAALGICIAAQSGPCRMRIALGSSMWPL